MGRAGATICVLKGPDAVNATRSQNGTLAVVAVSGAEACNSVTSAPTRRLLLKRERRLERFQLRLAKDVVGSA